MYLESHHHLCSLVEALHRIIHLVVSGVGPVRCKGTNRTCADIFPLWAQILQPARIIEILLAAAIDRYCIQRDCQRRVDRLKEQV